MKMNLNQAKLVELTMELDLRAREYKKLCDKLEQLKEKGINPNDKILIGLQQAFQKNQNDVLKINKQIEKIKKQDKIIEKQNLEKYNQEILSKNKEEKPNKEISLVETKKKNIFMKIWDKIKIIIKKTHQ